MLCENITLFWSCGPDCIAIPPLPEIANFSTKYFILSKVYSDEGGIKSVIDLFSALCAKLFQNGGKFFKYFFFF